MTRKISLVAVCCSRASVRSAFLACSSVSNRAFSIAITAWSAKVASSATCPPEKGRTSVRRIMMTPMDAPSRTRGTARMVRYPSRFMAWESGKSRSTTSARSST